MTTYYASTAIIMIVTKPNILYTIFYILLLYINHRREGNSTPVNTWLLLQVGAGAEGQTGTVASLAVLARASSLVGGD